MHGHWVHSRYPRRPEEGAGCSGTGVPGLCKPPQMCWAQTWVLRKSKSFNHWAISPTLIFNCYHPDPVTGISTSFLSTGQLIISLRGKQHLGFTFENFLWVSERLPSLYEHDADTWVVLLQYVTKFWSRQYTEEKKKWQDHLDEIWFSESHYPTASPHWPSQCTCEVIATTDPLASACKNPHPVCVWESCWLPTWRLLFRTAIWMGCFHYCFLCSNRPFWGPNLVLRNEGKM